jgi:O-acetyl-ADP-ribose deacetylase (regulator of RNase III)
MGVDAVVNAANTGLQRGGGVCGAIFNAAGAHELQAACDKIAPIGTGDAVITPGFGLAAKYIIHTAGPVYRHWSNEENETFLRACYTNSLNLAAENGCDSIAFPLISSGIYGYPKKEALEVATAAIAGWLKEHDMDVYLAVFDKEAFEVSEELLGDVENYIGEHYIDMPRVCSPESFGGAFGEFNLFVKEKPFADEVSFEDDESFGNDDDLAEYIVEAPGTASGLDDLIGNLDEPFPDALLRLIDAKGRTDVDVYKSANIDRKLFSKIRSGKGYTPSKRTAIALAVALNLTLDETDDLLERAGFALSHSQMFDVIIEYFIVNGKYDIFEINEVLFKYDQPLLGA